MPVSPCPQAALHWSLPRHLFPNVPSLRARPQCVQVVTGLLAFLLPPDSKVSRDSGQGCVWLIAESPVTTAVPGV